MGESSRDDGLYVEFWVVFFIFFPSLRRIPFICSKDEFCHSFPYWPAGFPFLYSVSIL
jgi:hypothetical protein